MKNQKNQNNQSLKHKTNMIFETVDRFNNIVTLSKLTYDIHVSDHTEMIGEEQKIQQCVEDPNIITKDTDYEARNYYKIHGDIALNHYGKYTKVSVAINSGSVKSAYFARNISKTEELIWKK